MPELAPWQWMLGAFVAFVVGIAKTGAPGMGTFVVPLMVMTVGDARYATAWTLPILCTADVFAVLYWRRRAESKQLFSLAPWVLAGTLAGALALGLPEIAIRRMLGVIVVGMMLVHVARRFWPSNDVHGNPAVYGIAAGFSSTVANAAGPVMNLYLLSRKLPKEEFVATGAWFFFALNLAKAPIYAYYSLYSRASLTFDLMMVPIVLIGAYAGRWFVNNVSQKVFEALVIVMTAISCLLLFR
ncbi:MAG: sulfite exporter TauE/SafE family protein [Acidobacteriota bacterium]